MIRKNYHKKPKWVRTQDDNIQLTIDECAKNSKLTDEEFKKITLSFFSEND